MHRKISVLLVLSLTTLTLLTPDSTLRADESRAAGALDRSAQNGQRSAESSAWKADELTQRHARPRTAHIKTHRMASRPPERAVAPILQLNEARAPTDAANQEKDRLVACAGHMPPLTRKRVQNILHKRLAKNTREHSSLHRFIVVGASASRASEFLTGFASEKRYHLAADWEFLRPTIEWFSDSRRYLNSFVRKQAAVSGTTAGNWVWKQSFCLDCPERLNTEIRKFKPAFALVMFGTNNISWGGRPGYEHYFKKWIAAGYNDERCEKKGRCLPPYEPGGIDFPDAHSEQALKRYIASVMKSKRSKFRTGYKALLDGLLQRDIVPLISTIPPMPRRWLDEDTVVAVNEEIRSLAAEYHIPLIDLWCALSPTDDTGRLDWTHPIMTNNKGIGRDRYHPQSTHAFDVDDDFLIHGYLVRNVLTLLRLSEMRDVALKLIYSREPQAEMANVSL